MTQRLLANDTATAGKFEPVDPAMVHPVVNGGAADSCKRYGAADREKLRFFLAMLAEKAGRWQSAHHKPPR